MPAPPIILVEHAAAEIDSLDGQRRALLACVYKTAERDRLAAIVAQETADALFGGLIKDKRGQEAVAEFISIHLSIHVDETDDVYFADWNPG